MTKAPNNKKNHKERHSDTQHNINAGVQQTSVFQIAVSVDPVFHKYVFD